MVTIAALLVVGSLAATALFVLGVVAFIGMLAYGAVANRAQAAPQVVEEQVFATSPATAT